MNEHSWPVWFKLTKTFQRKVKYEKFTDDKEPIFLGIMSRLYTVNLTSSEKQHLQLYCMYHHRQPWSQAIYMCKLPRNIFYFSANVIFT